MQIGDIRFIPRSRARDMRKQGFMPFEDLVVMKFVGKPDKSVPSNRERADGTVWSKADHEFVARKIAGS